MARAQTPAQGTQVPARPSSPVGSILDGRYRILRQLGAGGMGEVYEAEHIHIEKKLAIKLLHAEVASSPDAVQRFRLEARAASLIGHRNIVEMLDFGQLPDGRIYMCMELVDGVPLSELLDRPVPADRLLDILIQIGQGLAAAHNKGIVHRDIKPANIVVTTGPSGEDIPKILDFGIAKIAGSDGQNQLTRTGAIFGTPGYMAPEQAMGNPIDGRTDIYALGVILYQCFSGTLPFDGASFMGVLTQHITTEPEPVVERAAKSGRQLPPRLADVIHRSLQKNPLQRFQTMDQLVNELIRIQSDLVGKTGMRAVAKAEDDVPVIDAPGDTPKPTTAATTGSFVIGAETTAATTGSFPIGAGTAAVPPPADRSALAPHGSVGHTVATFFGDRFEGALEGREGAAPGGLAATRLLAVASAVPPTMAGDAAAIEAFLRANFGGAAPVRDSVVPLERPELPSADSHDFYCIFVARGGREGGLLETRLFEQEARPLEAHLRALRSDRSKVVVAIVDTPELTSGVRRQILHYRRELGAIVLPAYVGELRKLSDDKHRRRFFARRLEDAARRRPFAGRAALRTPTEFVGDRRVVDAVVHALDHDNAVVLVSGIPGSGKTSVVNMAYFELEATEFVRIHCSSHQSSVEAFCRTIAERLGSAAPDGALPRRLLRDAAHGLAAAGRVQGTRTVLVLEDADWLIALAAGRGDAAEIAAARGLWTELAELAAAKVVGVVATSVRGFVLQRRVIGEWENPFATHLAVIPVRGTTADGTSRIAGDLAAGAGASFSDGAVARLHAWSAGHIDLIGRICDRVFDGTDAAPLATDEITAARVDRACRALVAAGTTFRDSLVPWLDPTERAVLEAVARVRPRSVRSLKRAFADHLDQAAIGDALEDLRELGLVAHIRGRETVTIELLARWIRLHGAPDAESLERARRRRRALVATAMAALLLLVTTYWVWLRDRMVTSEELRQRDCVFQLKYPERAAQRETVKLYVFRECQSAGVPMVLDELGSTVATIDQRPLKFIRYGSRSERADVSITLEQTDASGDGYRFALETEAATPVVAPLGAFEITHDAMAGWRHTLEGAAKLAVAVLSALLVFVALQRRALGVLRRISTLFRGGKRAHPRSGRAPDRPGGEHA